MRVFVRIANVRLPWQFKDSDRLGDWIDSRPWISRSPVTVVRVADPNFIDPFVVAIEDAVLAADRRATDARTVILDPAEVATGGFEAAAARHFEIPTERPPLDLATLIGRETAARPIIWLIPPLPTDRPALIDETERFVDLVTKVVPTARLCVLFVDTPQSPLSGRCYDLTSGGPKSDTDLLGIPNNQLWQHYLHRRIAWESGGRLSRADSLARQVEFARLQPGNDAALEKEFTQEAISTFSELPREKRDPLLKTVEEFVDGKPLSDRVRPDLFWDPAHLRVTTPVPWVARAMLQLNPRRPFSEFLRGCLLCIPLAQSLLTACFLIENQVRGRIRLPNDAPPGAPFEEAWQQFVGGASFTSSLYPASGPSVPASPWAFASLGEILCQDEGSLTGNDWRQEVRLLRNHLAHGHYAGWETLQLTRQLISRLAS
ncbi:MAG: hypothetical protein EA381_07780 [Planctomycetaceae bacterium]|nr:MAG: hypothetical protein EA381_07780 [Planctomycetaceae bacterium]